MSHSAEHIANVLSKIQASVPKAWRERVVEEVKATPTIEMVMQKALTLKKISDEKKAQIKTLLDNGDFSRMTTRENPKYAKLIDQFVARKINQEIKRGNLPPRSKIKDLEHVKKLYENAQDKGDKK